MIVLAYLVPPSSSASLDINYNAVPDRILLGSRQSSENDEDHLSRFSRIFLDPATKISFDTLRTLLPFEWTKTLKSDTVNPFGDRRQLQYEALWTFDVENGLLCHNNAKGRGHMPFALLRERAVTMNDMQPLGGPIAAPLEHGLDAETLYWRPHVRVESRTRALGRRLLHDFHHQWRHILRNCYNDLTLRTLAAGIIRLSTLDFEVDENTGGHSRRGVHVWITHLPAWTPLEADIVQIGTLWVVLCQDLRRGLATVRQHAASQDFGLSKDECLKDLDNIQPQYMVLSIRYVVLCYISNTSSINFTAPEQLFNGDPGTRPASNLALDYLLWASTSARPSVVTPVQTLPVELQDMVVNFASTGTVASAKIGCVLGIGSPYSWKDGSLEVILVERYFNRPSRSPVESEIRFGKYNSGIVYLAMVTRSAQVDLLAGSGTTNVIEESS